MTILLVSFFSLKTKKPTKKRKKKSKNEVKHLVANKSLSLICKAIAVKVSNESYTGNVLLQPFYGICCIILQESKRGKVLTKTVSVRNSGYFSTTQ